MVVLPQPLGPTIATNSDCLMSRLMSLQASIVPLFVSYFLPTFCSRMYGSLIGLVVPVSNPPEGGLPATPMRRGDQPGFTFSPYTAVPTNTRWCSTCSYPPEYSALHISAEGLGFPASLPLQTT